MWRNFQVGESGNIPFGPVEFSCEVRKVLLYSKTDKRVQQSEKLLEKKKQKKIFGFFFCTEYGCNGMFSTQLHLDQYKLSGTHDYSSRSTSMDKLRYSFAEKIKQSSHFVTNPDRSNSITINGKCYNSFDTVEKKCWAIPKRKKFRYSEKQKSILLKYFEEGEQTGIKKTPEQVISIKISSEKIKIKLI